MHLYKAFWSYISSGNRNYRRRNVLKETNPQQKFYVSPNTDLYISVQVCHSPSQEITTIIHLIQLNPITKDNKKLRLVLF